MTLTTSSIPAPRRVDPAKDRRSINHLAKATCRVLLVASVWLAVCVVTGCALLPQGDSLKASGETGTVLLMIRFGNSVSPLAQPTGLALTLEDVPRKVAGQYAFKAYRSMPGRYSEFLVRLELPAGNYQVTRLFGVAGQGRVAPQFDFPLTLSLQVEGGKTFYQGRIDIVNQPRRTAQDPATSPALGGLNGTGGFTAGTPVTSLSDASVDDLVDFRTYFDDLRKRTIATRLPSLFVPPPQDARFAEAADADDNGLGPFQSVQLADASAARLLPKAARKVYLQFLTYELPRAFAYAPNGIAGIASGGSSVALRALEVCTSRSRARVKSKTKPATNPACVLFAVNGTLMDRVGSAQRGNSLASSEAARP